MTRELPMFPLGSVLFPHAVLPLHVFEPRYRELARRCLAGDREFGVVLIERGSEVGGGDTRFDLGTVARIEESAELPDGRWALVAVGARRLRVHRWLPDHPYPRAEVEELDEVRPRAEGESARAAVEAALRDLFALWARVEPRAASVVVALDADPVRASFEAAALAPIGPLDGQRILAVDDAVERLRALGTLLAEETELLRFRLDAS